MSGQGATTVSVREALLEHGWQVFFTCLPNAAHVNVVPIPVRGGSSRQRYPDILASRNEITLLVEVEVSLTEAVVENAILRFGEQLSALSDPRTWTMYKAKIGGICGFELPAQFLGIAALVTCKPISPRCDRLVSELARAEILVCTASRLAIFLDELRT